MLVCVYSFLKLWIIILFPHQTLVDDLKSELSGAFRTLMIMLTYATHEFLAIELHDTMAGAGTDEESLTEILMSRSNEELAETRNFYLICMLSCKTCFNAIINKSMIQLFINEDYGKSMSADIISETVGPEQDLLLLMANVGEIRIITFRYLIKISIHIRETGMKV